MVADMNRADLVIVTSSSGRARPARMAMESESSRVSAASLCRKLLVGRH